MTRPLSNDFPERVAAVATVGDICRSVAGRFSVATIASDKARRWRQRELPILNRPVYGRALHGL